MLSLEAERNAAVEAVRRASRLCQGVREEMAGAAMTKQDRSPVTVADFGAQAVVSLVLQQAFPEIPMVGEEDSTTLRSDEGERLRPLVVEHALRHHPEASGEEEVLAAIDYGNDAGGATGRRWVLDPIDGTKGFLRGDQYAVALALLDEGRPVLGVLGCPALPSSGGGQGCLFVASRGGQTVEYSLATDEASQARVAPIADSSKASFCESVESAHSAHSTHAEIAERLGVAVEPVRIDSQCKYAVVARGEACIYLRLPKSATYQEKIWDHAAGVVVVEQAGGRVTDAFGKELDFSLGRELTSNRGIVATNGLLHDQVLDAVRPALEG